jgi:hypothetical protein
MNVTPGEEARPWKLCALLFALLAALLLWWGVDQAKQVEALAAQTSDLSGQLAISRSALERALKNDLPLTLSYRTDSTDEGITAVFHSKLPRPLEVSAIVSSPRTGQSKRINLVIAANGLAEIGEADGWRFMPGHRIILSSSEFRPAEYVVPGQQ